MEKFKQKRIKRIIKLMSGLSIPVECDCNHKHKIELSDFEEIDGALRPRKNIRLTCAKYYEYLDNIQDIKLDLAVDHEEGPIRSIFIKIYVGAWKIWLNW